MREDLSFLLTETRAVLQQLKAPSHFQVNNNYQFFLNLIWQQQCSKHKQFFPAFAGVIKMLKASQQVPELLDSCHCYWTQL